MADIESEIKAQYARFFEGNDWHGFKKVAEYYLKTAAELKKSDVKTLESCKLLIRNIKKRLFIGIGCELILKAFYLKSGYVINKPKNREDSNRLYKLDEQSKAISSTSG